MPPETLDKEALEECQEKRDDSSAAGEGGRVCLTTLSDEEFENQLQLFQGRLSNIFEDEAQ